MPVMFGVDAVSVELTRTQGGYTLLLAFDDGYRIVV